MNSNTIYQAYASIMPPVTTEQDQQCWQSALPKTFWVNTLRISVADFANIVAEENLDCTPVVWHKAVYRAGEKFNPTKHWTFATGLLQMQEEAAMHCAHLLDPKPGDLALDTCAAPGNKSAQMAVLMQNQGSLIVNDMNFGRMRAFGQISKRLGLMNVSSAIYNAANLPRMPDMFDAIMVDVPCSCEGTFRKKWPKPQNPVSAESSKAQAKRQLAILNKAIQLAKPGAKLVYSTCTFSPYENEGVLTKALEKWGDQLEILPVNIDNFVTSPGVLAWQEVAFAKDCQKAARIWPHQNNTGGFFMALLRKVSSRAQSEPGSPESSRESWGSGMLRCSSGMTSFSEYLSGIQNRFGFPANCFDNYIFHQPTKKGWYINPKDTRIPENLRLDATGLFFYKTAITFPKLSTAAAMVFGSLATKNKVILGAQGRDHFLTKQDQELTLQQMHKVEATGYVLVFYQSFCLGVGLYFSPTEEEPTHRLRSLIDLKLAN